MPCSVSRWDRVPERSISGLDTSDIDAADLLYLHESFQFVTHRILLQAGTAALDLQLGQVQAPRTVRSIDVRIGPPARRTGLLGLVRRDPNVSIPIPAAKLSVRRDLDSAMEQPVSRRRQFADELGREQAEELYSQLYDHSRGFGEELEVLGLYADIPPECAGSIRLEENLSKAWFTPGSSGSGRLSRGYHLTVLRTESGKLRRLLLRLG